MKKYLSLLLVIVMVLGTLTACGSDPQEEGSSVADSKESAESTGEAKESTESASESKETEKAEVTRVTWWNENGEQKASIDAKVEEFNATIGKDNNVELVVEHIDNTTSGCVCHSKQIFCGRAGSRSGERLNYCAELYNSTRP